ncbi:site-specific integrase [Priestia megaterium]|uniref:site-specific integrase n=1 Tax=Priestia megaterium TaxID=1404 RepID=UPI0028580C25|nr:site-specific integrase [Priestia megaterium]MDR7207952.1 integrase [Priestia megaterium]
MASFQRYSTKQGQMWLFKMDTGVNPQTGKRKTTTRRGFKTKKEAQIAAGKLEQELLSGTSIANSNITFNETFSQWFSNHSKTIKPSTKKSIESKFKKHILPRFGKLKINEITRPYCQQMINEIAEIITSVNDIKIQANQVFKYAVKMDIIQKNPLEYVSIPKQQKEFINEDNHSNQRNYWKKDEVKKFLAITKEELSLRDHTLFHLLIYTGARKGELLALKWDDINFDTGFIRLTKTLFHNEGKFIFQTSKTKESKRLISLDTKTLSLLKKWRVEQIQAILANACTNIESKIIFTRDDGSPMRLAYLNDKLSTVIKKHKLNRITIHGLRHTHASLLFEAGASIKEVQERLGHSDIQMTMNIYTHVTDDLKEQTAEKFQRYIEL